MDAGEVLLVEDTARLAASIRDYLQKHQVDVHVEGNGLAVAARIERLRAVSKEDIRRVAAKYMTKENRTVVWVLPQAKPE